MSQSTVHRVLQNPGPAWIEEVLRRWAQPRLRVDPATAVDGACLRGAHRTGTDPDETVSRIEHGTGMPVSILHDSDEGGEIAAVHAALETAPVAGRLRTLDALHTPRETARRIVETQGADGMMTVKGHASKTFESIHWETTSTGRYRETPTLEHGRIEPRSIEVFTPPAKMIHDPHVKPIVRVTRRVECKKSGKRTTEHAYGRTSVAADRASPQPVLAGNRGPWGSNAIPPSATATFREDDSRLRARNAPANHAILHTLALAVILHHPRKRPQPFHRFADARHPYADPRKQVLHAVTRPGGPRAHPDRNRKYPSRATQPGRPLARPGSAETDPSRPAPRRHRAADVRTSQIADSNASTRAAIQTPIASQQQAWDLLGSPPRCSRRRGRRVAPDPGPNPLARNGTFTMAKNPGWVGSSRRLPHPWGGGGGWRWKSRA